MYPKYSNKIGLFSRIDYGSEGFREGLLIEMAKIFKEEDVGFAILLGGLISWRDIKVNMPKKKDVAANKEFMQDIVADLVVKIPKMHRKNGQVIKIYIIPSPAYDGQFGEEVVRKLASVRLDIRLAGPTDDRLVIKGENNKFVWGVTPQKAVWMRGDFYSTPVQRVIKDLQKRSSQPLPKIYFVGGFGLAINKPEGEEPRPYVAVPALHKLRSTTVAENQVGVMIAECLSEGHKVHLYSMKEQVGDDRKFIPVPENLEDNEKKIIEVIKKDGRLTVGLISDKTGIQRNKIKKIISALPASSDIWPGINLHKESKKYDFNLDWVKNKLRYNFFEDVVKHPDVKEDRLVAFGCLHAGCIHTDYKFFLEEFPEYLIKENVDIILGVGDFIEGLKHNLILRGEIYGAANNTVQEKLAAHMVAKVLLDVFQKRFDSANVKKPTEQEVLDIIKKCLPEFRYIPGNHCLWSEDSGYVALDTFSGELRMSVLTGLQKKFHFGRYPFVDVDGIVREKIIEGNNFQLPSGLKVELFHPHMSRAKTESIRAQEALGKSRDSQIVIVANFHVGIFIAEYNPDLGERLSLVVGTLKSKSGFEHNKLKTVDFGVGLLKVRSLNGRIFWAENEFFGRSSGVSLDNDDIFKEFYKQIGLSVK